MKEENVRFMLEIADALSRSHVRFHFLDRRWQDEGDVDMCVARESANDFGRTMAEYGFASDGGGSRQRFYSRLSNGERVNVHVHIDKYEGLPYGMLEPREASRSRGHFLPPEQQIFYLVYKIALGRSHRRYEKYFSDLIREDVGVEKLHDLLKRVFSNANEVLERVLDGRFSELEFKFTFPHNLSRLKMFILNKMQRRGKP